MSLVLNSAGGGSVTIQEPSTTEARTVTFPDASGQVSLPTWMTAQAASGTAVDFTGIPLWVRRITIGFSAVSTNGTDNIFIRIGSGSVETSGYVSTAGTGGSQTTSSGGFLLTSTLAAADSLNGSVTILRLDGTTYVSSGVLAPSGGMRLSAGRKTTSNIIDILRVTTTGGTQTFDAGTINVLYE